MAVQPQFLAGLLSAFMMSYFGIGTAFCLQNRIVHEPSKLLFGVHSLALGVCAASVALGHLHVANESYSLWTVAIGTELLALALMLHFVLVFSLPAPPARLPGVAERNALKLEFRRFDPATGTRTPIVVHLATQQGATVDVTVVDDIGAAAATSRYEDLHRFKVPQLRRIKDLGPYFHDNSAATLEDVVDYFNGDDYNRSIDGRRYPIHLGSAERKALLAFLRVL